MLVGDILQAADERGIRKLAFTDHYYPFTEPSDIDETRLAVEEYQLLTGNDIEIFYGCEAEVMCPGVTAGSPELADRLDFVMVGATHFQNKGITDFPEGMDDVQKAHHVLRNFMYAVSLPWVDVVAHPFFVPPGALTPGAVDVLESIELRPALELAKENNVALEISRRVFHTPEQFIFSARFYALCKEVGLKFTIGSDAHQIEDVANIRVLKPFLKQLELTEQDFWMPEHR